MPEFAPITPYPDINALLRDLRTRMQAILGEKLVGVYLYGSLVWGDFDHDVSDVDLLAALTADVDDREFVALQAMHDAIAAQYPAWNDRIETQYFSIEGLRNFREKPFPMCNISPGEPFHRMTAGRDWLMNWYFVLIYGITLYGPPPNTIIPPIGKMEFIARAREDATFWRGYVTNTRDSAQYQAYAILTLCRGWYTVTNGEQVSKRRAAEWAAERLPDWADLIRAALIGRSDPANNRVSYRETQNFVAHMAGLIEQIEQTES